MTTWIDASYAERGFQAVVLIAASFALVRRPPTGPAALLLLAVLSVAAWGLVQCMAGWTVYQHETGVSTLRWASWMLLFFLAFEAFRDQPPCPEARTAIAAFGASLAVLALTQAYTSHGNFFWLFPSGQMEVFGPFQNRNNYAAFIELTLPLALWEVFASPGRRVLWLTLSTVMAASVVAAASRAGTLLVAAELPAILAVALWRRQLPRRQLAALAATWIGLFTLCMAVTGWQTLTRRFTGSDPFLYRREMLHSAVAMTTDRPWTGFGLGTFPVAYPAYATFDSGYRVNHAHNDWAEWSAEGGLPFLLLVGTLAGAILPAAVRSGWGVGVPAVFLHGLVDFPMQRTGVVVWLLLIAAALAAERRPSPKAS
jgi:O-antigen ligase